MPHRWELGIGPRRKRGTFDRFHSGSCTRRMLPTLYIFPRFSCRISEGRILIDSIQRLTRTIGRVPIALFTPHISSYIVPVVDGRTAHLRLSRARDQSCYSHPHLVGWQRYEEHQSTTPWRTRLVRAGKKELKFLEKGTRVSEC